MGTNYYLKKEAEPACKCCDRPYPSYELHIGKSSIGWCFSLHVIPELGLNDWPEWLEFIQKSLQDGWTLEDEYGQEFHLLAFVGVVTERESNHVGRTGVLKRHSVDGEHCLGNGTGTWDLIAGEFC